MVFRIVTKKKAASDEKKRVARIAENRKIEEKAAKKRARNKKGQFEGDDPKTADKNEAYKGGKTPKKKK